MRKISSEFSHICNSPLKYIQPLSKSQIKSTFMSYFLKYICPPVVDKFLIYANLSAMINALFPPFILNLKAESTNFFAFIGVWRQQCSEMYFSKLYFSKLYFSKQYFSKQYFLKLYFSKMFFPKLFFSKLCFPKLCYSQLYFC